MPASALQRWIGRLPAVVPGARSLHRQLLLWLLLPQLVLWIVGAFVTYNVAQRYADRAVDASLSQATRALARQVKPVGSGLFIDFPRAAQDVLEADSRDPFYYMVSTPPGQFILGYRQMPPPPDAVAPRLDETVFYDAAMDSADGGAPLRVRVAALLLGYGDDDAPRQTLLVQVARSSANREELARRILVDTVLPLSALILLMTMIVWAGIRAGLAPLARLRLLVEGRAPNDLAPIRLDEAPPEVRALARAINELLAAVQHSLVAQRRFINDAAHQLRTPLAGLKSQTELALADAADPAQRARLQRVHDSATRSAHLVSQLLVLARAEPESGSALGRARFDLRRLARDLSAEWVPRALAAGVDLGFDDRSDDRPCPVDGTELLLREALANLVDNAIRYAGRGASVTVRVTAVPHQRVRVEVEDNGPGVPEAERERVFERFVRGDTQVATGVGDGCGLGLAIVREVVQRHGGTVWLEAVAPRGVRACIELPAAAPQG
jgi:two-component system, OmpR family, sensor histidine kinase TctE